MGSTKDSLSEIIGKTAGDTPSPSSEEMFRGFEGMHSREKEIREQNEWLKRYHSLPSYAFKTERDGSEKYTKELKEALKAITKGEFGSVEYKGYKVYYDDTPRISSWSIDGKSFSYSYEIKFECEALSAGHCEKYESEEERVMFLDPENEEYFKKTLALLDAEFELLDDGTWIRKKKTLGITDFRDYDPSWVKFPQTSWEEADKEAADSLVRLLHDALERVNGVDFSEKEFLIISDTIRRMVYFADYGKRVGFIKLHGLIMFEWAPETKAERFIWKCMNEFGQGKIPNTLVDNCTVHYFLHDPKGWEALAYLLPIRALAGMCSGEEPDKIKDELLKCFEAVPGDGWKERTEEMIKADRAKAASKGGEADD